MFFFSPTKESKKINETINNNWTVFVLAVNGLCDVYEYMCGSSMRVHARNIIHLFTWWEMHRTLLLYFVLIVMKLSMYSFIAAMIGIQTHLSHSGDYAYILGFDVENAVEVYARSDCGGQAIAGSSKR